MSEYTNEIAQFQDMRNKNIRNNNGWLSVIGLYWLNKGTTICGGSETSDIVIPCEHERVLKITFINGKIIVEPLIKIKTNHGFFKTGELNNDQTSNPDILYIDTISIELLKRHDRYALRIRDKLNPKIKSFPSLEWHPIDTKYCIKGKYTRHESCRKISITIALGGEYLFDNPGKITFSVHDREYELEAVRQGQSNNLFIIFKDETNGDTTYGAGRFLFIPFDFKDEEVSNIVIDFNKTISPPCAYTSAATCPLPPLMNTLPIRIYAGERAVLIDK